MSIFKYAIPPLNHVLSLSMYNLGTMFSKHAISDWTRLEGGACAASIVINLLRPSYLQKSVDEKLGRKNSERLFTILPLLLIGGAHLYAKKPMKVALASGLFFAISHKFTNNFQWMSETLHITSDWERFAGRDFFYDTNKKKPIAENYYSELYLQDAKVEQEQKHKVVLLENKALCLFKKAREGGDEAKKFFSEGQTIASFLAKARVNEYLEVRLKLQELETKLYLSDAVAEVLDEISNFLKSYCSHIPFIERGFFNDVIEICISKDQAQLIHPFFDKLPEKLKGYDSYLETEEQFWNALNRCDQDESNYVWYVTQHLDNYFKYGPKDIRQDLFSKFDYEHEDRQKIEDHFWKKIVSTCDYSDTKPLPQMSKREAEIFFQFYADKITKDEIANFSEVELQIFYTALFSKLMEKNQLGQAKECADKITEEITKIRCYMSLLEKGEVLSTEELKNLSNNDAIDKFNKFKIAKKMNEELGDFGKDETISKENLNIRIALLETKRSEENFLKSLEDMAKALDKKAANSFNPSSFALREVAPVYLKYAMIDRA